MPTRGHGLVLLIFWTMILINENLSFVNMRHEDWWFNLACLKDKIEMTLFVLRYVSCLLIFILGLKAPGTIRFDDDYNNLNENQVIKEKTIYFCRRNKCVQILSVKN